MPSDGSSPSIYPYRNAEDWNYGDVAPTTITMYRNYSTNKLIIRNDKIVIQINGKVDFYTQNYTPKDVLIV